MNLGIKFIALAAQAYREQRFTEAGVLFAQAAESEDLTATIDRLLSGEPLPELPEAEVAAEGQTEEQVASVSADNSVIASVMRDAVSPSRIARLMSASMEATASEEDLSDNEPVESADEEDEDADLESDLDYTPDPDIPGQSLIPSSFSSDEEGVEEDEESGDDTSAGDSDEEEESEEESDLSSESSVSPNVKMVSAVASPISINW